MKSSEKRVAIAFDLNFRHAAEIFSGVAELVAEAHLDWQLVPLNFGFESKLMELAASGQLDGAIGTFVSDGWVAGLIKNKVAAVNLFNFSRIESIPTVSVDDFALGAAASKHLSAQGARRFAFFGADGAYYTRLRRAGFESAMSGDSYLELQPGPLLRDHIQNLKKEDGALGVFCSSDALAREFILEARRQQLDCSKDILVVGVDNDPAESIFAGVGISSFKLPSREMGYIAAKRLADVLHGDETGTPAVTVTPPPELIPRESSLASDRARIAQRALSLLNENLNNPELEIEGIARSIGVSRRSLELAFREQVGSSPYRTISEARQQLARQLLLTTTHPVMEVGRRCGYPEVHHFSAWFKKRTGLSPKSYREQNR